MQLASDVMLSCLTRTLAFLDTKCTLSPTRSVASTCFFSSFVGVGGGGWRRGGNLSCTL